MLSSSLYRDETESVDTMLRALDWPDDRAKRVSTHAADLITSVRGMRRKPGSIESFFQQYGLNTAEGIALMCMAEALLRIPDGPTAGALIRDKVAGTKWLKGGADADWMTRAAGLGLAVTSGTMNSLFSKLGEPVIRTAMGQAMKILGGQFVVGQTLSDAQKAAKKLEAAGFRMSYDMLGEGARTAEDAARYFDGYLKAIEGIVVRDGVRIPGLSVKLSALHPRYEFSQRDVCVPALSDKLIALCAAAARQNIALTVDAEEVDRLEISLEIIENAAKDGSLKGWNGLGLAVQAYQKRAMPLIDHVLAMARRHDRHVQVRLVKGAYWDSEIKRAQVRGLSGYPVYTRKFNTDVSYIVCAQKMLNNRAAIYPMFGTHNAHTVAAIADMAGNADGYEFQKLFGMGDGLYAQVMERNMAPVSIYAPVGAHHDLLPYLVRRLLENGANSSFVNKIYDNDIAPDTLAVDPVAQVRSAVTKSHPHIPDPQNLYGGERRNSAGMDLNDARTLENLQSSLRQTLSATVFHAAPVIGGKVKPGKGPLDIFNPAKTSEKIGTVSYASDEQIDAAFLSAGQGFDVWSRTSVFQRAQILEKFADLMEGNHALLMGLCVKEAGKTLPDARDEVREAVDFCRYYAAQGRRVFDENGQTLPGPTGETNILKLVPRGVFVCISPWNFPLAIFVGQIAAALMAGNAVIAKPAEQTPLMAFETVQLWLKAGVPGAALQLLPGDGRTGAALVAHKNVAGVAFTGSVDAAWSINRTLAAKDGAIVPLIAETGGLNAMIADSSALPEQLVDDVVLSAFGSAGQRCSACRVLFVQDDIADKTLSMLRGAMAMLRMGDPGDDATDIGPVIDDPALAALTRHRARLEGFGKLIASAPIDENLRRAGTFFAPAAYEIPALEYLQGEVFGPILHVIRFRADEMDQVISAINKTGYGLTLGVHTRIDAFAKKIAAEVNAGNVYVNRSMIGAVVGVQPFGGMGLSGTGPKAGGPHYLARFANEKVVSVNTTAAGGNASLVMLDE